MANSPYLVYGANGYTGRLIARYAVERGHQPILAGRNARPVEAVASELGLPTRLFDLGDPVALDRGLADVRAVLHCAGPFAHTSRPMVDACLRNRVTYLDIRIVMDELLDLGCQRVFSRQWCSFMGAAFWFRVPC